MAPGIQPSQGVFGIGTPVCAELPTPTMANSRPQPLAAPCEEPAFTFDPWHSAAFSIGHRQLRDERAQQSAAQASEPRRHLHADDQTTRHSHSNPPIHTRPDAQRVNFDYAQQPRSAPQVPETFRHGHDLEQPMSPFGNGALVGYSTPDMRPGHSGVPRHDGQQGAADPGPSAWAV